MNLKRVIYLAGVDSISLEGAARKRRAKFRTDGEVYLYGMDRPLIEIDGKAILEYTLETASIFDEAVVVGTIGIEKWLVEKQAERKYEHIEFIQQVEDRIENMLVGSQDMTPEEWGLVVCADLALLDKPSLESLLEELGAELKDERSMVWPYISKNDVKIQTIRDDDNFALFNAYGDDPSLDRDRHGNILLKESNVVFVHDLEKVDIGILGRYAGNIKMRGWRAGVEILFTHLPQFCHETGIPYSEALYYGAVRGFLPKKLSRNGRSLIRGFHIDELLGYAGKAFSAPASRFAAPHTTSVPTHLDADSVEDAYYMAGELLKKEGNDFNSYRDLVDRVTYDGRNGKQSLMSYLNLDKTTYVEFAGKPLSAKGGMARDVSAYSLKHGGGIVPTMQDYIFWKLDKIKAQRENVVSN
ncbi:MAG: hypothetical protein ABIC95_02980 [archaeon]